MRALGKGGREGMKQGADADWEMGGKGGIQLNGRGTWEGRKRYGGRMVRMVLVYCSSCSPAESSEQMPRVLNRAWFGMGVGQGDRV